MEILVDFQAFYRQQFGGISKYHATIGEYINRNGDNHCTILNIGCRNEYVSSQFNPFNILNRRGSRSLVDKANKMITSLLINKYDVFHPSYYDPYFLKVKRRPPFVVTVHDTILEDFFAERNVDILEKKKLLLSYADAIIAISNATKEDTLRHYNIDPSKIKVIYHGYPKFFLKGESSRDSSQRGVSQNPYILFIGQRDYYKNFSFFLQAVASFLLENSISLKIIGPQLSPKEMALVGSLGIGQLVDVRGHVAENELVDMYNRAFCFVFPSLAEGFGMPLLESFAAECPVVCSDIKVFKEICGDAALFFDGEDQASLKSCLSSLLINTIRIDLINKGLDRLKWFEWATAADATLDVYKAIS